MRTSTPKFSPNQHLHNLISNIALVGINLLISIWYTPFLIRSLGSELFGFIPLADSVKYFLGIMTLSFNISLSRYLTIALEKGETRRANQILNTTLLCSLLIISFAVPIALVLIFFVPQIFNVPVGQGRNIQWLFLGTIAAFFLTTIQTNFSIATFAKNRFDLRNIVSLGARVIQVITVLVLFYLKTPNIVWIGIGTLTAALLSIVGDYFLWKRLLPELWLGKEFFSKQYLPLLFSTGIWLLLYQSGIIIFLSVDMLVANWTLTLSMAGMYGALLIIPKNLRILANAVGGIWGPSILSRYSQEDFPGIDSVTRFSIKIIGLSCALPIGLLSGLAKPILSIWLGASFESMAWVMIVMIIHLSVNLITSPFFNIQLSLNRIKQPALVNVALAAIYFYLAYGLSQRLGPMGIAIAGAFSLSFNNLIFSPIFTARIMKLKWWHYIGRLMIIGMVPILVGIASYYLNDLFSARSLLDLFWIGLSISLIYISIIYFWVLSKKEKGVVWNIIGGHI